MHKILHRTTLPSQLIDSIIRRRNFLENDYEESALFHCLNVPDSRMTLQDIVDDLRTLSEEKINRYVSFKNHRDRTPLQQAWVEGKKELVKLLINKGANVNEPLYEDGPTLLKCSFVEKDFDFAQFFIENRAPVKDAISLECIDETFKFLDFILEKKIMT